MSYNIDSIEIVSKKDFGIDLTLLNRILGHLGYDVPEGLCDDEGRLKASAGEAIWWHGEGSGTSYPKLVKNVLPRFHGSADLVLTWEGGDSFSGLRLVDGKVTEHEVVMALGKERK